MHVDIAIIGGGPVGLAAAIAAKRKNLDYVVLEKGVLVNSIYNFPKFMTFFTTADLLEIGDHPFPSTAVKPTRQTALDYYRRVAQLENLNLLLHHNVETIVGEMGNYQVKGTHTSRRTISEFTIICKIIVIATGYYDNPRGLGGIEGEDGPNTSYYYTEPHPYFNQNVVVIGAGNSGAEAALELHRHGANVTLIHKHAEPSPALKYWVGPDLNNRLKNGEIKGIMPGRVQKISPSGVEVRRNGELLIVESDFVFILTGFTPNIELFRSWGIKVGENLSLSLSDKFETNSDGIFVLGSAGFGQQLNKVFIENGREHAKIAIDYINILLESSN